MVDTDEGIEVGDLVTIAGQGPYEVTGTAPLMREINTPDSDRYLWVLVSWCRRVEPPFRPEPGTLWMDTSRDTAWRVTEDGERMRQLGTTAVPGCDYVQRIFGPLVELVPKEQADE